MSVPSDQEAEESVIGACLLSQMAIEDSLEMLTPGDFYIPSHTAIFAAIGSLHGGGSKVDPVTVADELNRMGLRDDVGGSAKLISLQSNTPSWTHVRRYALIVARHSLARQGMRLASEAMEKFQNPATNVGAYVDEMQAQLRALDSPVLERPPDDVSVDEFLDRPVEQRTPWAIEGLAREDWRILMVGIEGTGKTVLQTQVGVCASYGIHPLNFKPIEPANVLLVDLENPTDVVHDRLAQISEACRTRPGHATERNAYLWHRPGGIDLRKRADRLAFEDVLQRRHPNLVVIGPVYKMYARLANEPDEAVASEVQRVLDDMRTRFGFGLIMEHHAPKGQNGSRELLPFGSSLWLRWSELGFSLSPKSKEFPVKELDINSYRGDRVKHGWPSSVEWAKPFPWMGRWEKGIEDF